MTVPRFSVVMLLPDARGIAEQSVRSWSADQDFTRDQFELIVVSNGREPDVETRIRPLLAPHDRLLQYPEATRAELYDLGARAGRGEFVVFTESHCLTARTFLSVMDRFLRTTGLPAAFSRLGAIDAGALSRLDGRCNIDGFDTYQSPDDWRKLNVHSFALRRDLYLEAGGFRTQYGIFSELLLSDELWRRGCRPGLSDAPPVDHMFSGCPSEVLAYQRDVIAGEMRYYLDHPNGPKIDHTFFADGDVSWSERELERAAFAALWAERRHGFGAALRQGWRVLKLAICEGRLGRITDHAKIHLAANACRVIGSEHALAMRLFVWMWATAARLARKEYLATAAHEEVRTATGGPIRIDEFPARDLWGFHLPERWQGEPMRWTGRCAVMRLARPRAACELIFRTNKVGWPVAGRKCSFFVNGRRLPDPAVIVESDQIRVCLGTAKPGAMLLAVVCEPVKPEVRGPGETRELGLPLFSVEARAVCEAPLLAAA